MEQVLFSMDTEMQYPVLLIPKKCTALEKACEVTDDVVVDLSVITSATTDGKEMCIYSGFCNIKILESYDVNIKEVQSTSASDVVDMDQIQVVDANNQPSYSQSQVWIDPARSPYVYNSYDAPVTQAKYSVCHQAHSSHITVEQHNTYITQNVYNCSESLHYEPAEEVEHKKFRKNQSGNNNPQNGFGDPNNLYEDDEFECGVFLSQLSEEIINEKEARDREEMRYIGLESDNDALRQLMSSDIQSVSKQQKTILYLGPDSSSAQTIQKIAVNDPSLECVPGKEMDQKLIHNMNNTQPNPKKYQCDKCKQIFNHIAAFKRHMVSIHKHRFTVATSEGDAKFICTECGKNLKSQEMLEQHRFRHGDPDLECNKCHKVFASKFTLRTHRKIHNRKHHCDYCSKTFSTEKEARAHTIKIHYIHSCDNCNFTTEIYDDLLKHQAEHDIKTHKHRSRSVSRDCSSDCTSPSPYSSPPAPISYSRPTKDEIREADSVIAKIMSNKDFLLHDRRARKNRRYRKACVVCSKFFDRIGDLKRHLIEHVIRSTLAKNPVNKDCTLNIQCEVCQIETFSQVEKYKAHLREHAKLTIYQCTFCNKSFSDSSNFSKHKKIHGDTYLQCDLCQRKFNSKKMITQHMEYHINNSPIPCSYCNKTFHFESMLNKHIKYAHTRELSTRFRCRFCRVYFKSLKEKWDHEWSVHNVRKMIVDCLICGSKFRKYSELKRHCMDNHGLEIPPAKKLLKKNKSQ